MSEQEYEIECSVCGRDGGPYAGCGTCKGSAGTQKKAYTLSEHRSGQAPKENRYEGESVAPKTSSPLWVGNDVR